MASGDIALEVTGAYVYTDNSARQTGSNSTIQTTELRAGTMVVPAPGSGVPTLGSVVVQMNTAYVSGPVSAAPETLFDGGKRYTLTITED